MPLGFWTKPFVIFGVNAIVLFVGTGVMAKMLVLIKFSGPDGSRLSLQSYIYLHAFASWLSPISASLAFAIAFILGWLFLVWLLYRKRIIIKI
jgi:predicted acyltransferase